MITGTIIKFMLIFLSILVIFSYGNNIGALNSSISNNSFNGKVTGVIDGYTLEIDNRMVKLALLHDTEPNDKEILNEATHHTSMLCPIRSPALIYPDNSQQDENENNSTKKLSAIVYCLANNNDNNGTMVSINESLLEAKLGVIDKDACKVSEHAKEEWAQRHGCNNIE